MPCYTLDQYISEYSALVSETNGDSKALDVLKSVQNRKTDIINVEWTTSFQIFYYIENGQRKIRASQLGGGAAAIKIKGGRHLSASSVDSIKIVPTINCYTNCFRILRLDPASYFSNTGFLMEAKEGCVKEALPMLSVFNPVGFSGPVVIPNPFIFAKAAILLNVNYLAGLQSAGNVSKSCAQDEKLSRSGKEIVHITYTANLRIRYGVCAANLIRGRLDRLYNSKWYNSTKLGVYRDLESSNFYSVPIVNDTKDNDYSYAYTDTVVFLGNSICKDDIHTNITKVKNTLISSAAGYVLNEITIPYAYSGPIPEGYVSPMTPEPAGISSIDVTVPTNTLEISQAVESVLGNTTTAVYVKKGNSYEIQNAIFYPRVETEPNWEYGACGNRFCKSLTLKVYIPELSIMYLTPPEPLEPASVVNCEYPKEPSYTKEVKVIGLGSNKN